MNTKLILCFYLSNSLLASAAFPDELQTESLRQAINAWIDHSIRRQFPTDTLQAAMKKLKESAEQEQIRQAQEQQRQSANRAVVKKG